MIPFEAFDHIPATSIKIGQRMYHHLPGQEAITKKIEKISTGNPATLVITFDDGYSSLVNCEDIVSVISEKYEKFLALE
jgi:hypothetical protein